MARHRPPLGKYAYTIKENVRALRYRMKPLNQMGITHDEFLELFALPEHWEILKTASGVADVRASGGYHVGFLKEPGAATIHFAVSSEGAPLMPRNRVILRDKASPALMERLTSWVNEEIKMSLGFARAIALIEWLDSYCDNRDQIRFLWPSIIPICNMNERTAPLAERLREFKSQRSLPALPMEVRKACRETAGLIAAAGLMPEQAEAFTAPVVLSLHSAEAGSHEGALGFIRA